MKTLPSAALAGVAALWAAPALAQDTPALDSGDTAWMLTSTALVLMMTIPGLAMFYGGMVRKKNLLATAMQSFATCCLATVLWMVVGYSLAFAEGNAFIGGLDKVFLAGMGVDSLSGTIPESVFMTFQMTFAIITPALITGAVADRMKFSSLLWFIGLWSIIVYAPITHWVWGGGFLFDAGVLDFAGGTVVHINSGVAGLVAAILLGKRVGHGSESFAPHNLTFCVIGGSLLWVGWFGFNAGSAVAANGQAGMAMAVTQIATAAAALAWMFAEWIIHKKPSVLGMGATSLKHRFGYDDSLDVFAVHGLGGITGAILTGVFAAEAIGGAPGLLEGNAGQVWIQIEGIVATIVWSAVATAVILLVIKAVIGLRVSEEEEREGLDIRLHGESIA
jgi:Amt family ammonium transporter